MKTNTLFSFFLVGGLTTGGDIHPHIRPVAAVEYPAASVARPTPNGPLRHVAAAEAGRVWEVYVQTGSAVKRGQLLAKVAVPLHTVAQQQAETRFRQAQQHYQHLLQAEAVPAAELALAQQQAAAAGQLLAALPRQIAFVFVQAPTAGVVARLPALAGAYLAVADTVLSIQEAATTPEVPAN